MCVPTALNASQQCTSHPVSSRPPSQRDLRRAAGEGPADAASTARTGMGPVLRAAGLAPSRCTRTTANRGVPGQGGRGQPHPPSTGLLGSPTAVGAAAPLIDGSTSCSHHATHRRSHLRSSSPANGVLCSSWATHSKAPTPPTSLAKGLPLLHAYTLVIVSTFVCGVCVCVCVCGAYACSRSYNTNDFLTCIFHSIV